MPNKLRERRPIETIVASGYARLYEEAPDICAIGYGKLLRMEKEGRLRTFGSPKLVEPEHLFHQVRNDFPQLEENNAA